MEEGDANLRELKETLERNDALRLRDAKHEPLDTVYRILEDVAAYKKVEMSKSFLAEPLRKLYPKIYHVSRSRYYPLSFGFSYRPGNNEWYRSLEKWWV